MNCPMRSLPPPRRSRVRRLRMMLHKLYSLLTLQWITQRKSRILVKKRRTPFHFSRNRYKVKRCFPIGLKHGHNPPNANDVTQDLNDLLGDNARARANVQFKPGKRLRIHDRLKRDRRYLKRLLHTMFRAKRVYDTVDS